jgi:regulator of cell morphogenesis and NO signaling
MILTTKAMVQNSYENALLGELVTDDFRVAEVFMHAGIDFCCGGKKTLEQACREKNIDLKFIEEEIRALEQAPNLLNTNFKDWEPGFLADYIINMHHKYVQKTLPELLYFTKKIASVHGGHHPELIEVAKLFEEINRELQQHLQKEEEVLFPAIRSAVQKSTPELRSVIGSEIARMSNEHEFAGGAMDKINELTAGYLVPQDGCNSYQVAFKMLRQFEDDLHIHVHLENNILYPKALKM